MDKVGNKLPTREKEENKEKDENLLLSTKQEENFDCIDETDGQE